MRPPRSGWLSLALLVAAAAVLIVGDAHLDATSSAGVLLLVLALVAHR